MKKRAIVFLIFVLIIGLPCLSIAQESMKKEAVLAAGKNKAGISHNSRRKIAVIPFRTIKDSYDFNGKQISSSEISRRFTRKLVNEIIQTRRFAVLDREYMNEFLGEKKLIQSADAPVSEQVKLGKVLGADYLLTGTINEAGLKHTHHNIQVTGESVDNYSASFNVDYRIVALATRQIKWSDSIAMSLGNAEIKRIMQSPSHNEVRQFLLEKAAKRLVRKTLENFYPIRVVKVRQDGEVILNHGGMMVSEGEILKVFNKGKKIFDPYTEEILGNSEKWIANIKISRVIPGMSYARVIKGRLSSIRNGSICRRASSEYKEKRKNSTGGAGATVPVHEEGVFLPFDNKNSPATSVNAVYRKEKPAYQNTAVSNIDNNIPSSNINNNNAIAVVIGNRDYSDKDIPSVDYAINDAQSIRSYLLKIFGYREGNIIFAANITKAGFEALFGTKDRYQGKLYNYLKKGESDIFIYYSGHGAPDTQSKHGFFVPVDADSQAIALTGHSLQQFYDNVTRISKDKSSPNVYIIIDACFSGISENGALLKNVSPVYIEVDNPLITIPNAVVMTSSKGTEVSSWYPEQKHSMFTYFFLKTIKDTIESSEKHLTVKDLYLAITDDSEGVPYYARRLHGRQQNPQIFGDSDRVMIERR